VGVRLVTFQSRGKRALGAVEGTDVVDLQLAYARYLAEDEGDPQAETIARARIPADMAVFIAGLEPSWRAAEQGLAWAREAGQDVAHDLDGVQLLAPIVPPVILNSGQNYWDHRDEKPPVDQKDPEFFLKAPLAAISPNEPIVADPAVTTKLDYEVELAVIETGTPGGTAWATDSEIGGRPYERDDVARAGYLAPGDVVRVEIDGIGLLENPVVALGESGFESSAVGRPHQRKESVR
jgi:2-keto-4-pentenoate hydratase/2-oxohepta-3-ene-1,7-dioic acid hydratase in catechol pathway